MAARNSRASKTSSAERQYEMVTKSTSNSLHGRERVGGRGFRQQEIEHEGMVTKSTSNSLAG